jgi:serine/threonine protein kinase
MVTVRDSGHGRGRSSLPETVVASPSDELAAKRARVWDGVPVRQGDFVGGAYRIRERLGGGSMGQVFSAFDEVLERSVAIKLIRANLHSVDYRRRFMLEARAMALVSHPNVLTIHALGEHESSPFIVMELVEGQTLDRWLAERGSAIDLDVALNVLNQICAGVGAIHAAGTLHRDIKPSNILLHRDLRVRVSDLGLAIKQRDGSMVKELVGTPGYIAPEIQCPPEGRTGATPQSDLYSLACVAYEVLTGKPPFSAQSDEALAAFHAVSAVPPPSSVRPELPVLFDPVLLRALAKEPEARYANVEQFRAALLGARSGTLEPRRILVADDDPDFRELLELVLRRDFPCAEIECVSDGRSAVAAFDREPASVVVLDLHMPELDGFGVTALLRARSTARAVPIVMMTALGGPKEWELLSSLGADRFLVKPMSLDDLVTSIRGALRERSAKLAAGRL